MSGIINDFIEEEELSLLLAFLFSLPKTDNAIILRNELLLAFAAACDAGEIGPEAQPGLWRFLRRVQEMLFGDGERLVVFRHRKASCRIFRIFPGDVRPEAVDIPEFLAIKERLFLGEAAPARLTVNLAPFYDYGPKLKDPDSIGHGITFLNRFMSANLASQPEKWHNQLYEFLKLHQLHGRPLLLDGTLLRSPAELDEGLANAMEYLKRVRPGIGNEQVNQRLGRLGFLPGWGGTAARILETMELLQGILEQPSETFLAEFLARIPMISRIVLVSPHGWFAQEGVLGRPDTGGQVVYILDQARALAAHLRRELRAAGCPVEPEILIVSRLIPESDGTTCNQRLEPVRGSRHVRILRVPFRDAAGNIVPHWISRFHVWPWLDRFAEEAEAEIRRELGGRPDLIIGNYSDGNLVATRLAKSMGVTQGNIAHALEKSKYLFSSLYWRQLEPDYHFSLQFVADLIAMNLANFIVTSTSQEITGTNEAIGQYESYRFFTMPGLMQVRCGINLFHPRFNVIPPGVNEEVFFPYTRERPARQTEALERLLFEEEGADFFGRLEDPGLPPIFTIARLDRIKNITGLVEAYGREPELRKRANLVLVASVLDPNRAGDQEERGEIERLHGMIEEYGLHGNLRWIGRFLDRASTGEVYRIIADRQGVFVQPALFEAFGLTVLEAMHSGLPVFATQFGGPLEIIEHEKSGFLVNTTDQAGMARRFTDFFVKSADDPRYWQGFSRRGLKRVQSRFTWEKHCRSLVRLGKVHGFWRYSTSQEAKSRLGEYCELLYQFAFRERADRMN